MMRKTLISTFLVLVEVFILEKLNVKFVPRRKLIFPFFGKPGINFKKSLPIKKSLMFKE